MRILLVSDFYPPVIGGLELHVDALAAEFARGGDEVTVATLTPDARPTHPAVRAVTVNSAAHRLPHERADRPFHPPLPDPVARRSLKRLIAEFRPDVIHGHSWLTVSVPRAGVPVLFTAHDYALVCAIRTLQHLDADTCSGPALGKCVQCSSAYYGRGRGTLMGLATPVGGRVFPAERIIAVSAAVASALRPHARAPITVLPNFVGPEPEHADLPAEIPDGRFVLFAGDPRPHKGVPDLLDVWRDGQPGVPLVLASPHPLDGPLPDGVVSVSLTRGQMAHAWRRSTLAAAPSRWGDPCPTVVLEAMRAGVPVIGTTVGGIPDLVRDGLDGVLVPPSSPDLLGAAIRGLLDDDARRSELGANAAARSAEFTVEPVARRIREEYTRLVAGGHRAW